MAAGSPLEGLTCQDEEKAPGHSLHVTAAGQGCKGGDRVRVRWLPPAQWESKGTKRKGAIAYRAVLGKLLTSVSPFRDDNSSVLWGYMN